MRGKLITLEGLDGAGKSTHLEWLADRLRRGSGRDVIVTREPGGTPLGERLRALILGEPMDVGTETLLVFAARQQHLAQVIRPALNRGDWVLSDRFTDATFAYQGGGRELGFERVVPLADWVHHDLWPDLTLLLDLPVAAGLERAGRRNSADRFERERSDFFERVREAYLRLAQREPRRFRVVAADAPLEQVQARLRAVVTEWLTTRID